MIKNTIITILIINLGASDLTLADQNTENVLQGFFANRCRQFSSDAIAYDNFKGHLNDFLSYLEYSFNNLVYAKKQFCSENRENLKGAMRVLANDLYPCLPKTEKYLPKFLYESFKEFLDFLCRNDGRNIDNFFSTQGKECRAVMQSRNAQAEVEQCFTKIFSPLQNTVKREELCEDLNVAKKCLSQTLQRNCPEFGSFQNLNNQFFEALSKPCGGSSSLMASLFVILACLTASKIFS